MSATCLNVCCGDHADKAGPDWLSMDLYSMDHWAKKPDVICSIFDMPFEDNRFLRAYMGHCLEHLEYDAIPDAIAEMRRVCKSGATIAVVGPCVELAERSGQPGWLLKQIARPEKSTEAPGIEHRWTPTAALTRDILRTSGLKNVTVVDITEIARPDWPNPNSDAPWQCAMFATVP